MKTSHKVAFTFTAVLVISGMTAWARAQVPVPARPTVVKVAAASRAAASADSRRPAPKFVPRPEVKEAPEAPKPGSEVLITRESYAYPAAGRRDPFLSLMNTEEIRPLLGDLKLVAVAFDPSGRNSVAVLRDVTTKEQYRVKVGQELGRMRVASIREKNVIFGIEEFGYSRQESLAITDSTQVRTQ